MNTFIKSLLTKKNVPEASEPNFLVLEPTQEEIKELDGKLINMMKKIKLTPEERMIREKENEKEYNKKYYASKKNTLILLIVINVVVDTAIIVHTVMIDLKNIDLQYLKIKKIFSFPLN